MGDRRDGGGRKKVHVYLGDDISIFPPTGPGRALSSAQGLLHLSMGRGGRREEGGGGRRREEKHKALCPHTADKDCDLQQRINVVVVTENGPVFLSQTALNF